MKNCNSNTSAFFALLRAGLWENGVRLSEFDDVDFEDVYRLASEQSVVGLVAAGLERTADRKIPQSIALTIVGDVLQLEQRNRDMDTFIAKLMTQLKDAGVHSLLVKGQGIAQCYERPLWRSCGDVDLVLDDEGYEKAYALLSSIGNSIEESRRDIKHTEINIDGWMVELHGTLRSQLGKVIDNGIDAVQKDTFVNNRVREWRNGDVEVLLPAPNNDVIFVFTHILQHFFNEGCGLRQICDWCRLLWTYHNVLDVELLENRLVSMRLMTEWKAFAALAVDTLGMPPEAMPLYSKEERWKKKGERVLNYVLRVGNMGHNRDLSYRQRASRLARGLRTFGRVTGDAIAQANIFPVDALRVWWLIMTKSMGEAVKG